MIRNPSLFLRVARAVVGLVTVWCLGCTGYDSILDSLMHSESSSMMTCASQVNNGVGSATLAEGEQQVSIPVVSGHSSGFDCGCGSCSAPSPVYASIHSPSRDIACALQFQMTEPKNVSRIPLVPPPEFVV